MSKLHILYGIRHPNLCPPDFNPPPHYSIKSTHQEREGG